MGRRLDIDNDIDALLREIAALTIESLRLWDRAFVDWLNETQEGQCWLRGSGLDWGGNLTGYTHVEVTAIVWKPLPKFDEFTVMATWSKP